MTMDMETTTTLIMALIVLIVVLSNFIVQILRSKKNGKSTSGNPGQCAVGCTREEFVDHLKVCNDRWIKVEGTLGGIEANVERLVKKDDQRG